METSAPQSIAASNAPPHGFFKMAGKLVPGFDAQRGHLFPWAAVFFGGGAASYFALTWEPERTFYLGLSTVLLVLLAASLRFPLARTPGVTAAVFAILGCLWAGFQAHNVAAPVLEFRYYGPIEGRIVAIDKSGSDKPRLTLDQVILDRVAPAKTPKYVRVSLHGDQPFLTPEPGLRVMTTGHLSPPSGPIEPGGYDFQRKTWFDQLGGLGYTRVPMLVLEPAQADGFSMWLYSLRRTIAGYLKANIGGREGPFAAAILTGDRADLDTDALVALRASNLAHLLAISGLHMGLLTGVVFALVRWGLALAPAFSMRHNPKKIAALCALVVALAYLGISGASVATQRAFIMVSVMLCAVLLEKRAITLRAVAIAALLVMIIAPDSVTGPGFQMSFAATTALVATFAWLRDQNLRWTRGAWFKPVFALVVSSGIAGLATAPFGAAHFNQMAQYGLLANLLSVPVMGSVVMSGAVAAVFLYPLGLDWIGLEVMRLGLAWILGVAERVAGLGGSVRLIPAPPPFVLPLFAFGGLMLCLLQGRIRASGILVVALSFGLWANASRPELLISDTGRLTGFLTAEGRVLNKPKGDGFTARGWLENDADPADQETAAGRAQLDPNFAEMMIGAARVTFIADKTLTQVDLVLYCKDTEFLIAPLTKDTLPCAGLNAIDFRKNGAHSVRATETGLAITNSRDHRGSRLWVR